MIEDRIATQRQIIIQEIEAMRFACNAVCVGRHIVLPEGCPDAVRQLQERGYEIHSLPLDEFMKAGGSAKCLTLALE